nr:cell division protein ZapA [Escherichia coli]
MTPQQENALRSIARQANSEIKKARQHFPDKNVDDICRSVLKKHRETVTLMGLHTDSFKSGDRHVKRRL